MASLQFLESLELRHWKVPSGEITNLPYLRKIGCNRQPVILSTGMSSLGEIEAALNVLEQAGTSRSHITVLHCTTEYPAPFDEVNLRAMTSIGKAFGVSVGYSDHTEGIFVPIAAVAMGATIIEKHFTLDRDLPGPDHKASLEPDQFSSMVQGIRAIEHAFGDGIKRPTVSEQSNLPLVRKSIVAARSICEGELFSEANLTTKRPGTGISPMEWDHWIGRPAHRDFCVDDLIQ
jgi:N,N'-diacetyllegionaminate synthase